VGSLPDAELSEDPVEDVIGADAAHQFTQRVHGLAHVDGDQLVIVVQRQALQKTQNHIKNLSQ
jgi:hypothetical protein